MFTGFDARQKTSAPRARSPRGDAAAAALVRAAAAGDHASWETLVDRFGGLVWAIARAHRLTSADAADVSQTTWLLLVEHLDRIRRPELVGSWLASTAHRECLRVLRQGRRLVLTNGFEPTETEPPADANLLATERAAALWRAVETLPDNSRMLMRVLIADPPPTYEEVAAALGMPLGSIGPTRGRALDQLRKRLESDSLRDP